MSLEFTDVTDPPNVIAFAIGLLIRPIEFLVDNLLTDLDRFEHRARTESSAANIIDFADSRGRIEMVEGIHQIEAVYVVTHLFPLIPKNLIGSSSHRASHQIGQKSVQLGASMVGLS